MLAGEDQLNENGSDPIASTILEKLDIDLYLNNLDNYYNNAKYLPLSVEENRFLYYALLTHLLEIENGKSELGV